ncbi:MAG: GNAT family N-acetyltransferase [Candidatus Liptonbacteria bacterium]|nr:GNAT family N-acetyltransferase [Candidatus Liptonbacteria bacterium]
MFEELSEKSLEDPGFLKDIHGLMMDLSKTEYRANNFCYWASMLRQPGWHTLAWRDDVGRIIGMGSINLLQTPKAHTAIIHDVVVLEPHRGAGIGRVITEGLVKIARDANVDYVELTSNPKRKVARSNYEKRGFKKRATGVYRLTFD